MPPSYRAIPIPHTGPDWAGPCEGCAAEFDEPLCRQLVRECADQNVIFEADPVVSQRAACALSPASQVTAGGDLLSSDPMPANDTQ